MRSDAMRNHNILGILVSSECEIYHHAKCLTVKCRLKMSEIRRKAQ